jgi:hypothetical protein
MSRPRRLPFLLAATLALGASLLAAACAPAAGSAGSAPAVADPAALGSERANAFFAAIQSGDPAQVGAVLAPEAVITRANGDVIGRDDYLQALPVIKRFEIQDVAAQQSGDTLVVTYNVETDQVIDGAQQPTTLAPRLSVFQYLDGEWKLLAHANYNAINR